MGPSKNRLKALCNVVKASLLRHVSSRRRVQPTTVSKPTSSSGPPPKTYSPIATELPVFHDTPRCVVSPTGLETRQDALPVAGTAIGNQTQYTSRVYNLNQGQYTQSLATDVAPRNQYVGSLDTKQDENTSRDIVGSDTTNIEELLDNVFAVDPQHHIPDASRTFPLAHGVWPALAFPQMFNISSVHEIFNIAPQQYETPILTTSPMSVCDSAPVAATELPRGKGLKSSATEMIGNKVEHYTRLPTQNGQLPVSLKPNESVMASCSTPCNGPGDWVGDDPGLSTAKAEHWQIFKQIFALAAQGQEKQAMDQTWQYCSDVWADAIDACSDAIAKTTRSLTQDVTGTPGPSVTSPSSATSRTVSDANPFLKRADWVGPLSDSLSTPTSPVSPIMESDHNAGNTLAEQLHFTESAPAELTPHRDELANDIGIESLSFASPAAASGDMHGSDAFTKEEPGMTASPSGSSENSNGVQSQKTGVVIPTVIDGKPEMLHSVWDNPPDWATQSERYRHDPDPFIRQFFEDVIDSPQREERRLEQEYAAGQESWRTPGRPINCRPEVHVEESVTSNIQETGFCSIISEEFEEMHGRMHLRGSDWDDCEMF